MDVRKQFFFSVSCGLAVIGLVAFAVAQTVVKEEIYIEDEQTMPSGPPIERSSGGYLNEGASIYGIKGVVIEDDSPLTELKLLRKKYYSEIKRSEQMESENRILKERVEHLEAMMEKKNQEIESIHEEGINTRFKYVSLENKLTNLRMAILRKKLIRESKYPPYYEVKKNDCLWRIAAKRSIYDNPYKWINLYHANQDKIADPDYIYPGLILTIPRPEMDYEDWTVDGLELDELRHKIDASDIQTQIQQEDPSVFPVNLEQPIKLEDNSVIDSNVISEDAELPEDAFINDDDARKDDMSAHPSPEDE